MKSVSKDTTRTEGDENRVRGVATLKIFSLRKTNKQTNRTERPREI